MVFHTYKIEHFGKDSAGAYVDTATELSDIMSINVSFALGEISDGFSFTMWNGQNTDFESIEIDDKVKIYGYLDGTTEVLLMDGLVNDKQVSGSVASHVVTFSGLNLLEKMFNALVSTTGETVQKTASEWIQIIIGQVNDFNQQGGTNRAISFDDDSIYATTKLVSFARAFEKAFNLIEELSQPELTGSDTFYYYLDTNNKFFWQPRPQSVTESLEFGNEIMSFRSKKGMFDLVNYIILNAGKNAYGSSILDVGYDVESINKFGWKTKLVSNEGIADALKTKDRNSKPSLWTDGESFPNAYDYVTAWGDVVSSDSEYNASLVEEVYAVAQNYLVGLLVKTAEAAHETNVEVLPTLSLQLGSLSGITIEEAGWSTPHNSRIDSINLSFNENGWTTNLTIKDDAGLERTA